MYLEAAIMFVLLVKSRKKSASGSKVARGVAVYVPKI